ncbi:MAG: hypothetical protein NDJ89_05375 [Oligoflexia bacterium]|nr:hypothetical protein [Oligoflexia bacterium]
MRRPGGFSLISVIVAMGVATVGFMALMQMSNVSLKAQKFVQYSTDFDLFKTSVRMILDNPKLCEMAIQEADGSALAFNPPGLPLATPISIARVRFGATGPDTAVLNGQISAGLVLKKFEITYAELAGTLTIGANSYKNYSTLIEAEAEKPDGSLGTKSLRTRFAVNLLVNDATKKVEQCFHTSLKGARTLVMHSQSSVVPACPPDWVTIRNGYSYLGTFQFDRTTGTDLASEASCLESFIYNPILQCGHPAGSARCNYFQTNDRSLWLKTPGVAELTWNLAVPPALPISRCTVCRKQASVYVRHNTSDTSFPSCGADLKLWEGYTLNGVSFVGSLAYFMRMDMGNTGSCLTTFDPAPGLFCGADDVITRCRFKYDSIAGTWGNLGQSVNSGWEDDVSVTGAGAAARTMRCAVCEAQ